MSVRAPHPYPLPQPGWRLIGFASIGLGSGLYTAQVPIEVLALAFVPAVAALLVLAARAVMAPIASPAEESAAPPWLISERHEVAKRRRT